MNFGNKPASLLAAANRLTCQLKVLTPAENVFIDLNSPNEECSLVVLLFLLKAKVTVEDKNMLHAAEMLKP